LADDCLIPINLVFDAQQEVLYIPQAESDGDLICHGDAGAQYVSIRYSRRLAEASIEPWKGCKYDSFANAPWPRLSTASTWTNLSIANGCSC